MSNPTRALAAALTACLLAPAYVRGAGFALFEQGSRAMGFAGAFTAQADDPSAIFHNAAGLAFLKGRHLYLGPPSSPHAPRSPAPTPSRGRA